MVSQITVKVCNESNQLVVDSRLIAESLGIQHRTFVKTIRKYQVETEQAFGILSFKSAVSNKVGNPETYCFLNENQATYLMTLSRNTEQVRKAKLNLVVAFSDAKELIKSTQIPKAPAKLLNRNYASSQKECRDQLNRHGADGRAYSMVERYNNQLSGIEPGRRHEVTAEQANQLSQNYLMGAIELLKRDLGFNDGCQYWLGNTTKKAMRHGMYDQLGVESVPESLKPKKERKQLKAS